MSFNFVEKVMCIGGNGAVPSPLQFYKRGFIFGGTGSQPSWQDIILSGVGSLTLANAKANGLNYLKLFGSTEQRNLPSEYTQVEFLESSGTQYIDTGIVPNNDTGFSVTLQCVDTPTDNFVYGARQGDNGRFVVGAQDTHLYFGYGTQVNIGTSLWNDSIPTNRNNVKLNYKNSKITQVNNSQDVDLTSTLPAFGTNTTITLFGRNSAGTVVGFAQRVYNNEITQGNNIIRNYIPCRRNSDNVLGMYDTVTGNFLTNAGTGDFTAGADVTTPSPDTPMDIYCNNGVVKVSPNLFTREGETLNKFYDASGVEQSGVYGNYSFAHTDFLKVKPNATYTFGFKVGFTAEGVINHRVIGWTSSKSYVKEEINITEPVNTALGTLLYDTFTTSATTEYVTINFIYAPSETEIQLVQGSSLPAKYMPYGQIYVDGTVETVEVDTTGDTANAEMLLSVGDYKDVQSVLDGGVIHRCGIKVLDGTEEWVESSTVGKFNAQHLLDGADARIMQNTICFCTHFLGVIPSMSLANMEDLTCKAGWISGSTNFDSLYVAYAKYENNLVGFKQYLADQYAQGTPVIVVYPLAEPTTETVTGQPLSIQAGTNVITAEGSIEDLELEVSYKAQASGG